MFNLDKIKQIVPILLILLLLAAIPASVLLVKQRQELRSKAADGDITLEYKAPDLSQLKVGDTFDVDLVLNAGAEKSISAVDLEILFDKSTLEFLQFEPKTDFDTQIVPSDTDLGLDSAAGKFHYTAVDKTARPFSSSLNLATMSFKVVGNGNVKLGFGKVMVTASCVIEPLNVGVKELFFAVPPSPEITSIMCTLDPKTTGTLSFINGVNFGPQGEVRIAGEEAEILKWIEQPVIPASTPSAVLTTKSQVEAKISQPLTDKISVTVITKEGRELNGTCKIGLTTAEVRLSTQCSPTGSSTLKEANIILTKDMEGAKPVLKEKLNIDSTGLVLGFSPVLEVGQQYVLEVRAPHTLSRVVRFIAEEGTTVVPELSLPIGDIYGQGGKVDNAVNSVDKAELVRQWNIVSDVTRTGDFNGDSRVNSIDYSCMRENIGKSGEIGI